MSVSPSVLSLEQRVESQSGPLHGLAHYAPLLPTEYNTADVHFQFSNDNLASTYSLIEARKQSPSFQAEEHPTALLIGESSLMASIRYMPESTLLMVDHYPKMVAHMAKYVEALRSSRAFDEWMAKMGYAGGVAKALTGEIISMETYLEEVAKPWTRAGLPHPATNHAAFEEASELAREKAIIPWRADIAQRADMRRLGKTLRAYGSGVTVMNVTNVLIVENRFMTADDAVTTLEHLPVTADAPIITTTAECTEQPGRLEFNDPAGLFFGLQELREKGGLVDAWGSNLGRAGTKVTRC